MAITSTATSHSAPIRRNATSRPPTTLQLLRDTLSQDAAQPSPAPATAHLEGASGPGSGFSERQVAALSAPLDRANVRQREQGRSRVSYLEGWQVIAEANRIFGFDGWERCTLISRCVAEHERPIGRDRKSGWGVTYTARVRITVTAGHRTLIREGSGAGHGIDADKGLAHESALKEAETDATKRALMTFGNPFGLALYDKQQRQVSDAKAPVAAADAPLQPAAITGLQERIKALAPARLEAFSKGFRAAFQVPEAQPSLAGLITTSRHQRWIESFLAESATA
ncbi:RAD52 family DNA repair protein [Vulcanococcus sp. Clear-D1]|uniref:RAD52 family DNA repair protein n=1 Tax=Vulcanococcus sp. Clear-D1 TaxID=2766970 RepID=UPI0025D13CD2|nr:RAD52 family DNA repair protein [Vulcanococcus sp. Clear-D1]